MEEPSLFNQLELISREKLIIANNNKKQRYGT